MKRIPTNKVKSMLTKKKRKEVVKTTDLLSTGSALLNLACTGRVRGGFVKGHYFFFVGDSDSGKTFITLTALAEASINPSFDQYDFVYDGPEDGAMMDIRKYFGKGVARRMRRERSRTIEDFYFNLDDALRKGKPFIWILDSMDALSSDDEESKFKQQKLAYRKGREMPGSYGDGKARKNSSMIRQVRYRLRDTGSILIVINQSRANIGGMFEKTTNSGGHALKFYAALQLWSSQKGLIKKKVRDKTMEVGQMVTVKIRKNRITGKKRTVSIPIYHSYGIDDLGSCVDYLLEMKHWRKVKGVIDAPELDLRAKREDLIAAIEENGQQDLLRTIVGKVWNSVEAELVLKRKPRYL